ncbi:MAG TPA: phosphoribosyltransferase family protein [Caldimonas sp.]|nr:phosphoribosyltransferase family protein [Caldimonas sp.]
MLATRWPNAVAAVGHTIATRGPSVCAVCRGWGRGRICASCLDRFAAPVPRCRRCALPLVASASVCGSCLTAPPPFEGALAAVDYRPPWDRLVTAFKFHGALDLAAVFADAIVAADRGRAAPRPSLLLPVPLAATRWRERGYNQAWELARRVSRRLRLVADPDLLLRVRDTAHQLALPLADRAGNVRGAFAVEPRRRAELRDRHVAIVDDVMTTGSTAAEIAAVVRQAGASTVEVWVLARTPRPGDA